MKLTGRYQLLITGDTNDLSVAGGRSQDLIGYLFQRLLTGQEVGIQEELASWKIEVRLVDGVVDPAELRAATEDTVIDAIDASDFGDVLHGIAPVVLLEFFNEMVDRLVGREE